MLKRDLSTAPVLHLRDFDRIWKISSCIDESQELSDQVRNCTVTCIMKEWFAI